MSKNLQNFLKRFMKQVIVRLLNMSSLHFTLQFLVVAVLVSVIIIRSIDFIWDGRFNAELEFAGVVTPFLDGLFLVVFVNAMLNEIREELAWRKQAVAESRKQQELTTQIIETIPLRIFWKDKDSRYLGCNTQFAQDAGRSSPDELTGKTDFEMGWKHQAELYRADDKAVMESGKPKLYIEEPQTTPSGNTIWISTSKVPLRDESQQVIGILGIYQDITERKQTESAITEQLEELRRWHDTTLGREGRILELKHEINQLLAQTGQPPRYPSAES